MSTAELIERLCEAVPASTVKAGDEILIHRIGLHLVAEVDLEPPHVTITYFSHEETTHENRARDRRGMHNRSKLVLKELRGYQPDEKVLVIRGSAGAAQTMQERLEREQIERWASKAERTERAQHFERERALAEEDA
jgi:hypothetical protein